MTGRPPVLPNRARPGELAGVVHEHGGAVPGAEGVDPLTAAAADPSVTPDGDFRTLGLPPELAAFADAAGMTPHDPVSLAAVEAVRQGHLAERANRTDLAAGHYRRALLADPHHPGAHHRLAVLLDRAGTFAAAEQHYRAALATRPHDPELLCDLGYSYLLQGRPADAETRLRDALAAAPEHRRTQENLAVLYARRGEYHRAEAALVGTGTHKEVAEKLAALFPDRPVPAPEVLPPLFGVPGEPAGPVLAGGPVPAAAGSVTPAAGSVTPAAFTPAAVPAVAAVPGAAPAAQPLPTFAVPARPAASPVPADAPTDAGLPTFSVPKPAAPPAKPVGSPGDDLPTWGGFSRA